MKSEYLVYLYALAVLIYAGLKVFHIHLRVLDSFLSCSADCVLFFPLHLSLKSWSVTKTKFYSYII